MSILKRIQELWRYRELIRNLVIRDLKTRYKNSFLGIAWSWTNPLLMMLVFTVVFGLLAGSSDLPHYHIFVLCALLPWNLFTTSVGAATVSIVGNAHLIKKVYFPSEVLPIALVISNLINYLISLPVFFGLVLLSRAPLSGWALLLPVPILVQTVFLIGISLLVSTLNVFFRDTQIIMDVLLQAWFFVTPILYPLTIVPQDTTILGITFDAHLWLRRLNPMASIIASYRDLLYWGTPTGLDFLLRTAMTALVVLVVGYLVFTRYSSRFAEEV